MKIPFFITNLIKDLEDHGFEGFLVGGSVRDFLLERSSKGKETVEDWDLTTNATPEEMKKIWPNAKYENQFGTVILPVELEKDENDKDGISPVEPVEITTYRIEEEYSDARHPDKVRFTNKLEEDLARRDFTINAMAYSPAKKKVVDPYGGKADLEAKIIRCVGNPEDRFGEDALRMIRAIRIATIFGFAIEEATSDAIIKNAPSITKVANERIRDELVKIYKAKNAAYGFGLLFKMNLLSYIMPEFTRGVGVSQNRHHTYTVFEHALKALKFACEYNYSLEVRIAAMFHDIAKPIVKRGDGYFSTFHNHDRVGAKICRRVLKRLRFPNKIIERSTHLVRHHMFFYSIGEVSDSGVRRLVKRVGPEYINDLMDLRISDRMGSGCAKPKPYKLIELEKRIKEVQKDPISVKMLAIDGVDLMSSLKLRPSPALGFILNSLLEEVLEDPILNTKDYLLEKAGEYYKEYKKNPNKRVVSKDKFYNLKSKIDNLKETDKDQLRTKINYEDQN